MIEKLKNEYDLYLILTLSAVVIILDLFDLVQLDRVVTAILAVLALLTLGMLKNRTLTNKLEDKISKVNVNQQLTQSGINNVYPNMPYDEFTEKIKSANTQIIILQTWLKALNPISDEMIDAANRGVKIRILILDPESDIAKQRSVELGLEWDTSRPKALFEGVQSAFKKNDIKDKIEVRLHKRIPPYSLYMVDDWMLVGFYWHGRGSVSNQMIEFKGIDREKMGWLFLDTFDEIWKDNVGTKGISSIN